MLFRKISVIAVLGGIAFTAQAQASTFSDTSFYQWKNSIGYLQDHQVVQGYADGTFKPDQLINRAEFTKIIMAGRFADELGADSNQNCFSDVAKDQWYTQYVCLAKTKNIVGGYPDGTFKPSQNINQAEALKILLLAFDQNVPASSGEWYQRYLDTAQSLGMDYFAHNNAAGYQVSRGEMAYFTAWLMAKQATSQPPDQISALTGSSPFTYTQDGDTYVVTMDAKSVQMKVLSGNNSLRPKDQSKCSLNSDCVAEAQAENFNGFVNRSHKELLVNGAFFDAYSQPLNGTNFHQISSDIVMNGQLFSMFGYGQAFGNGGMLTQNLNGDYKLYFPIRDWVQDSSMINFGISNYPMILSSGHVRTKDEIGSYTPSDSKFWTGSRRGGLGLSADGKTVYYVSTVGTVEDLGNKMLESGAADAFALDAGASGAFSLNGQSIVAPGRSLTTVVEFYRK